MKINIIVKALIAKGIFCISCGAYSWGVAEKPENHVGLMEQNESVAVSHFERPEPDIASDETQPSSIKQTATSESLFQKKLTKLTLEEKVTVDYRKALENLTKHEPHQAEMVLINNLQQLPSHHPSRVELATYYIKNHQNDAAEMLLQEGLRFDENHPDFLRLMAVIWDRKDEPEKALSLLLKVKDSQKQDENYISFLGHIYQELGSYSLARQQYFKLLQRDPQNALWLLGVSIALDSEGQRDAALEGYQRLSHEGSFEPDVRQYIKERIQSLKG